MRILFSSVRALISELFHAVGVGATALGGKRAELQSAVQSNHFGKDFQHILRDSLIVYRNEIFRLGVDSESLVESESSFNVIRA
jgi:hypothetical protein